jgi:alpha-galactosidase
MLRTCIVVLCLQIAVGAATLAGGWPAAHDDGSTRASVAPLSLPLCDFAFTMNGVTYSRDPTGPLAKNWTYTAGAGWLRYTDPSTGFYVQCNIMSHSAPFTDVREWVVEFGLPAGSSSSSVRLTNPLTMASTIGGSGAWQLLTSVGSNAAANDFQPLLYTLSGTSGPQTFQPAGGRSSTGAWPFFSALSSSGAGLMLGVGWTGNWAVNTVVVPTGLRIEVGLATFNAAIPQGTQIRCPSVVLVPFISSRAGLHEFSNGWNRFRRLVRQLAPQFVDPPLRAVSAYAVSPTTWSSSSLTEAITSTAAFLNGIVPAESPQPVNTFWIDAGYNVGGFPDGQGNWGADPSRFDNASLRSVADAAHANNLSLLVWFEPERVMPGTNWSNSPSTYLSPAPINLPPILSYQSTFRLLRLGDSSVFKAALAEQESLIDAWKIDIWRQDFNMDPQYFWEAMDAECPSSGQGLAEVAHIKGLYNFWDSLRSDFPNLRLDICASGGRRMDWESLKRAWFLWRSDYCWHDSATFAMTYGLSLWLPTFGMGSVDDAPLDFRAGAAYASAWVIPGIFAPNSSTRTYWSQWVTAIQQLHFDLVGNASTPATPRLTVGQLMLADFYILAGYVVPPITNNWLAFQFHNETIDAGVIFVYRGSSYPAATIQTGGLGGLCPTATYTIGTWDGPGGATPARSTYTGADLLQNGLGCNVYAAPGLGVFPYWRS